MKSFWRRCGLLANKRNCSGIKPRRSPRLTVEVLEDRTLPSVTAALLPGGVLDIGFSADNDAATLSVLGPNLDVTAAGTTSAFSASSVLSLNAHGSGNKGQSLTLTGNVTLSGGLDANNIAVLIASNAAYRAAEVTIAAGSAITVQQSQLLSTGDVSLTIAASSTQTIPLVTGATAADSAQVNLTDAIIQGHNVTLQASSTVTAGSQLDMLANTALQFFGRIQDTSSAQVTVAGASVINATGNVAIGATSTETASATASALATSTSANLDADVALADDNSTALATVSGQTAITAAGSFQLQAANTSTVQASADGAPVGVTAQGGSVAIASLEGTTRADFSGRATVNASSVTISASSTNTVTSTAKSTAGGALQNGADTAKALAQNKAATPDGSIGVAGAVAINELNTRQTQASISTIGNITATGAVAVQSSSSTVVSATADGNPTGSGSTGSGSGSTGSPAGFGVGVAINEGSNDNRAVLGGSGTVKGSSITVSATAPQTNSFTASATSGAGGTDIGVAGAFALNLITNTSEAQVPSSASLNVGGADVTLNAQNASTSSATAKGKDTGKTGFGFGPSIALDFRTDTTRAAVEQNAALAGAHNLTLSATGNHTLKTSTDAGAQGKVALTPSVAIASDNNATTAALETGPALTLTGSLSATTSHTSSVDSEASGDTSASTVAIGASVGLNSFPTPARSATCATSPPGAACH
jgi:hypothetical protein